MTDRQFAAFSTFRNAFKAKTTEWSSNDSLLNQLKILQKTAADADFVPAYPIENPIVYNTALDAITQTDDIKLIVIGDNPGKNEQLTTNRKYLVGQAGKIADGFFKKNPELGIDFRKNVIILNKTPIHTAKTKELQFLLKEGGATFRSLFYETQQWMAQETAALQKALSTPECPCAIWLVGYAELKPKGLFTTYRDTLSACYNGKADSKLYVYQHFSMNCFSIDLKKHLNPDQSLAENLKERGLVHRREIFGF